MEIRAYCPHKNWSFLYFFILLVDILMNIGEKKQEKVLNHENRGRVSMREYRFPYETISGTPKTNSRPIRSQKLSFISHTIVSF